ncbi:hypothetical protein Hanom_Chr12g01132691 [Helianthus anomalus]
MAHHGFSLVGDSGGGRKPNGLNDINWVETFNYADKGLTKAYRTTTVGKISSYMWCC